MQYALYVPNYGKEMSARAFADLAAEAQEAVWDGFFMDHILGRKSRGDPMVDPWITLAAMAMRTEHLRIGTAVTPIPRRRPWKLARETVTLDHLSNGRLTLSVGIGFPPDAEFEQFGEESDDKIRAEKLDEGLAVLAGLWRGQPFAFQGKHYQVGKSVFKPAARQALRIPIWVGGFWPHKGPFRRAARWDGVIPLTEKGWVTPKVLREILSYIHAHRTSTGPYDAALIGHSETTRAGRAQSLKQIEQLGEAGMTWWLESLYSERNSVKEMRARIRKGPPKP
jgi:alkanesulfonate monooxygenase SsuD/methylene tetrahydromethanopterin reductase-like flavin-dependent oxidoreductase (luciferase family)